MNNPELPEQNMDLPEARISWADSFLTDWLIPLIEFNRIDTPRDIIELREKFQPLPPEPDDKGIDFTIQDVLVVALRWRAHNQKLHPHIPEDRLPSGKELRRAIDLLNAAVHDPPQPEVWTQTTFLTE